MRNTLKVVGIVFSLLSFAVSATPLNKIIVFGDSLSDNGNLYEYMKHQLPLSPPYFEGRFSNGPVWVELITKHFYPTDWRSHLLDYAFGGAGVLGEQGDFDDENLFSLNQEIDSYLLAHQNRADEHSLFMVWIGANNYLAMPEDLDAAVKDVIWGIKTSLQRLVDRGAKHILVLNLPDLGTIPAAHDFDTEKELSYSSLKHNDLLAKTMDQLKADNPSVEWISVDVNILLEQVLNNPEQYGLTNTTDTCYEALLDTSSAQPILNMVAAVHPRVVPDKHACDGYFFFDPVHPSGLVHEIIAQKILTLLQRSEVDFN